MYIKSEIPYTLKTVVFGVQKIDIHNQNGQILMDNLIFDVHENQFVRRMVHLWKLLIERIDDLQKNN